MYEMRKTASPRGQRKKVLSILLALTLAGGMIVMPGCAKKTDTPATEAAPTRQETAEDIIKTEPETDPGAGQVTPAASAVTQLGMPEYPEQAMSAVNEDLFEAGRARDYAAVAAQRKERYEAAERTWTPYGEFLKRTAAAVMGTEKKNTVWSPLSLYLTLGMLSEVTDGSTREQLLGVIGTDSAEETRRVMRDVWTANYQDDGAAVSRIASSLWLRSGISYKQETIDRLTQIHQAASFAGPFGDPAYDAAFRTWLSEQTGGLLDEQASQESFDPESAAVLANALYLSAKWQEEYWKEENRQGVFHGVSGDQTVTYMNQSMAKEYYWGSRFAAIGDQLLESGRMWFFLPDEGVDVTELLSDPEVYSILTFTGRDEKGEYCEYENCKHVIVDSSVPKFDVAERADLTEQLRSLGITAAFEPGRADFSPLTEETPVWLSQVLQAARVKIDEEGVEAAAYTVAAMAGAAMPPNERVEFRLDRPFLFAVTGPSGQVLFMGTVCDME